MLFGSNNRLISSVKQPGKTKLKSVYARLVLSHHVMHVLMPIKYYDMNPVIEMRLYIIISHALALLEIPLLSILSKGKILDSKYLLRDLVKTN